MKEQGFDGNYSVVKHFVRGKNEQLDEKAPVRFETMPGLQAQVDWAFFNLEALKIRNTLEILDNYLERAIKDELNIVDVLDHIFAEEARK